MKIRAVVFDLFGTLIANYDRDHYISVIERMGNASGTNPIEFKKLWRQHYVDRLTGVHKSESHNIRWVCDQLNHRPSQEEVEAANQKYLEFALPFLTAPRKDSVNVLTELKSHGIKTGLLSDCGPWVANNWADSPFADLIDFPVFSCISGTKKPDERLYRDSATGLNVPPELIMYVADGNGQELIAAAEVGMRPVRITPWNSPGTSPDADFSTLWDGESIDGLSELLDLLTV